MLGVVAIAAFAVPRRQRARPATVSPALPREQVRITREGLVIVNARTLFDRIRRTGAKGVVVNVWASWCGSCKADLPMLLNLRKAFGSSIDLFLVSVDEESSLPLAAEMLRGFGAPGPNFIVDESLDAFKRALNPRWPGMLPATFLFDPTGKLRYFWGGPVLETDVAPLLRRYLAGEHIDGEANFALAPGAVTH